MLAGDRSGDDVGAVEYREKKNQKSTRREKKKKNNKKLHQDLLELM